MLKVLASKEILKECIERCVCVYKFLIQNEEVQSVIMTEATDAMWEYKII